MEKIVKILLGILILGMTVSMNLVLMPIEATADYIPSERATVISLDWLSEDSYFFKELIIDPRGPYLGEEQIFSIWARDVAGVAKVTVIVAYYEKDGISRNEIIELNLVEGAEQEGQWQGSWRAKGEISWYSWYNVGFVAKNSEQKEGNLLTVSTAGAQPAFSPDYEYEAKYQIDLSNFPSERAEIYYISSSEHYPKFYHLDIIDPSPINGGEIQICSLWAKDPEGIEKITATVWAGVIGEKRIVFEMRLVEGTAEDGRWIGVWKARYLFRNEEIYINFEAVNKEGENTTLALPFWAETVETPPVPTIILNDIPYSVNELESINGTASSGYFSLNKVLVSIKNTTDNTYWNGSSWASTETWLEASGIESWSYSMPELTPGESYEVKAKAIDKIGNESVVMDSFKIEKSESYIWLVWPILGGVIIIGGITIYLELKKGKRSQP